MKYTNTSRTLSFLFHGLIVLAFGALGIYFGCFVVPQYFGTAPNYWTLNLFKGAYLLYLELAVMGLSFAIISGFGLYQAVQGLLHPRDDAPVVKSLTVFIAEGWAAGIFFLLQAVLFFDLTGSNGAKSNLPFVIIMGLLLAIIILIATNIPMVKLYDGKDQKMLLQYLIGGVMVITGVIALQGGISLLVNALHPARNAWVQSEINWLLFTIFSMNLSAFILFLIAYLAIAKTGFKVAGFLSAGAVISLGVGLLAYGILTLVWRENGIHLNYVLKEGTGYTFGTDWGYGFPVMNIVIGTVTLGLGSYLFIASSKSKALVK